MNSSLQLTDDMRRIPGIIALALPHFSFHVQGCVFCSFVCVCLFASGSYPRALRNLFPWKRQSGVAVQVDFLPPICPEKCALLDLASFSPLRSLSFAIRCNLSCRRQLKHQSRAPHNFFIRCAHMYVHMHINVVV